MDYLLIRHSSGYDEYPITKTLTVDEETFHSKELRPFVWQKSAEGKEILYVKGKGKTYRYPDFLTIADPRSDSRAGIRAEGLKEKIRIENGYIIREAQAAQSEVQAVQSEAESVRSDEEAVRSEAETPEQLPIYLNTVRLAPATAQPEAMPLNEGDTLLIDNMKLIFFRDGIFELSCEEDVHSRLSGLSELPPRGQAFEGFPRYKRSPRIIKRIPTEEVSIQKPPTTQKMSAGSLVQMIVTPLVTMLISVGVSILMKRGLFVLMSVMTTLMALAASITKYRNDKKDHEAEEQKRNELYENYLLETRKKIHRLRSEEIEALEYNNPSIASIEHMVNRYSSRIYERNSNDDDFLSVCVGSRREKISFKVKVDENELEMKTDELESEARGIRNTFEYIDNKPVTVDLKQAHLGLVGEKEVIHEQLKLLMAQITFFHSYHDVQVVNIFRETYNSEFKWMNWYPHLRLRPFNVFGCVNNDKMRDQVLGSMYQILKDRKIKREESNKEFKFRPHYVFIIDEPKLIMDHPIMEYLGKGSEGLGFSIIYTTHLQANLPENIGSILLLHHSEQGTLLLDNKVMVNRKVTLARTGKVELEKMARNLSVLIHEQGIVSSIPESITFFAMYGIEHPKQLNIAERWKKNESHKTLAVPLGVRAPEDYVYLNLHEKAHGPHGLVAGTTGSGKSEIVQSYILSLAVNYHPYEVGFLLIDYKGGGMAGLFRNLPHLLGTITNLDGSESMRAMASIKSELARRQRMFSENNVNHINAYNKLFKLGEVQEPIPHLFLISDEFAELKKEQPEFMTELVSAARIGRSLGIHLILATQKPAGVVNDQIWTNSKFKLALKVQDEADSREMLKTPDAAFITQPGRAYLQVGNNEIYELFQSAWSGAAFTEDHQEETVDNRVYLVNELGQGELLNEDLSGATESNQIPATQLDVTVDYMNELFAGENVAPVKRPWLPPLGIRILSPYTLDVSDPASIENREDLKRRGLPELPLDLSFSLGVVDIPEEQAQCEYRINLMEDGNMAYFSASGFGKSFALTTVILSLALKNSVDLLNFYILDFGNSALVPLNALPHTADYIAVDDEERLGKFVRLINKEIADRKKLFAEQMVQNFSVYNQSSEEKLKAIVIVVDNYDVVKEAGEAVDNALVRLSRDGAGLGIYLIVSATKASGIKYAAQNNYKIKIAGYMFDASDAAGIVGRSTYKLPEIKGRALVKLNAVSVMQTYSMVAFRSEVEYNTALKALLEGIQRMYPTKRAPRIPILPNRFLSQMLAQYQREPDIDIALGLDKETVILQGVRHAASPFVIVGESARGKTNMLKVILDQVKDYQNTYLFDSKSMELYSYKEDVTYIDSPELRDRFLEDIDEETEDRENQLKNAIVQNPRANPKDIIGTFEPFCVLIDDMDDFLETFKGREAAIAAALHKGTEVGISLILTVHAAKPKGYDDFSKWIKTAVFGLQLGAPGSSSMLTGFPTRDTPPMGTGLLFKNGAYQKILLPEHGEIS